MTAAVGFTVKSGWASAVLLTGPATAPSVADVRRVELSDPAVPDSFQPYHAGFGTARAAGPGLRTLVASAKRFGRQSVTRLIRSYESSGHTLRGAGVVVGSLIDPATIGNDHIRIHALEGELFRGVVTNAVNRCGLGCAIWRERDLYGLAAATLSVRSLSFDVWWPRSGATCPARGGRNTRPPPWPPGSFWGLGLPRRSSRAIQRERRRRGPG